MCVLRALALLHVTTALVAPRSLAPGRGFKSAGHRHASPVSMIDVGFVASSLAVPSVLVGTGTFLVAGGEEEEEEDTESEVSEEAHVLAARYG